MAVVKRVQVLACDFCGKDQHQVSKLIAGNNHVCICNECVALCVEIIEGRDPEALAGAQASPGTPETVKG